MSCAELRSDPIVFWLSLLFCLNSSVGFGCVSLVLENRLHERHSCLNLFYLV